MYITISVPCFYQKSTEYWREKFVLSLCILIYGKNLGLSFFIKLSVYNLICDAQKKLVFVNLFSVQSLLFFCSLCSLLFFIYNSTTFSYRLKEARWVRFYFVIIHKWKRKFESKKNGLFCFVKLTQKFFHAFIIWFLFLIKYLIKYYKSSHNWDGFCSIFVLILLLSMIHFLGPIRLLPHCEM